MILTGISSMYKLEKGYANLDTQANSRGWTRSLVRGRRRFPFQQWYYAYNQSWLGKGCLSLFQSFFLFARLNEAEVLCILEATKPPVCVTTKGLCYKRGQAFMHTCICIGTPMGDLGHMRNLADLGLFTSSPPAALQSILPAGIEKWAEWKTATADFRQNYACSKQPRIASSTELLSRPFQAASEYIYM